MKMSAAPVLSFAECRRGFWRMLPLSLFVAAFGAAFGVAAVQAGLRPAEIVLMSVTVFAGTAQFAALDLWGAQVPLVPIAMEADSAGRLALLATAGLMFWSKRPMPAIALGIAVAALVRAL
ncbi:MAG: AzlC family ABC transporter permease [Haliea sp.]|jgi:hypothetical protein|nr:AzlC family ABC transporter permease [Haliea sp.]MDP4916554.1 AzlC family ABC transporter permease [Haliea sp.]MDP5065121.1 AzlC family ABC transporter permease [Haliea sp.]